VTAPDSHARRRLRIGLTVDRLDPRKGGMEAVIADLVRFLAERGHELHGFTLEAAPDVPFRAHRIAARGPRARREALFAARSVLAARAARCHVLLGFRHCPGVDVYYPHAGLSRYALARRLETLGPLARTAKRLARGASAKHRLFERHERLLLLDRRVQVVAVSPLVADLFVAAGVEPDRITVAQNGVDAVRFRPRRASDDPPPERTLARAGAGSLLVLYVSHNFRLKGLGSLLRALRIARAHGDFHLAVLGRDRAGPYRRLASRLGIADHVAFLGTVPAPERFYRAADAFVLPTAHDPCSLATLEAMAAGLPVVTTRTNGALHLVVEGESALDARAGIALESPSNENEIARALVDLLPLERRAETGRRARRFAEGLPWSACFERVESVLARAASGGSGGGTAT